MLSFISDSSAQAYKSELFRFCRDERLDYDHILAGIGKKRRKTEKVKHLLKEFHSRRQRRPQYIEPCCPCTLCVKAE